jgi:hypothetical protein
MSKIRIIGAFCTILSTSVFAHGGHTAIESHIWHYMFSPDHLLIVVLGVLAISGVIWRKGVANVVLRRCAKGHSQ